MSAGRVRSRRSPPPLQLSVDPDTEVVVAGGWTPPGSRRPLHLSVDPWWELLEAVAFGVTTDGVGAERWVGLHEQVGLLVDGETALGVVVRGYAELDAAAIPELWTERQFDVPVLGLRAACPGDILLAVQERYGEEGCTADALHQHTAMAAEDPVEALVEWRLALEAGDMKAHYAVGYTLCELGRHREAYQHLRWMTELAPANAWAWCWLGRACEGTGDVSEARTAYERAIAIGDDETDAPELLAALG